MTLITHTHTHNGVKIFRNFSEITHRSIAKNMNKKNRNIYYTKRFSHRLYRLLSNDKCMPNQSDFLRETEIKDSI